jgi:hypothetical protein
MYTKDQIWSSFAKEINLIKHIAERLPEGSEHHKPTEQQRTTLELLHYLSGMGAGILGSVVLGDAGAFAEYLKKTEGVTRETFADMMDMQATDMKAIFDEINQEQMNEEVELWGGWRQSRALFILDLLKMMTAYKMQLFLYAKAAGNSTIGTSNLWAGMDMPTPAE